MESITLINACSEANKRPSLEESWDVSFEQPSPETCPARDLTFLTRSGYCQLLQTDKRAGTRWVVVDCCRNIPIALTDPDFGEQKAAKLRYPARHSEVRIGSVRQGLCPM
jgi:hypothetical protein